uniref:LysR substrate-binding domain-containing protein n=1 Tax=Paractinoplanes polyasparticus TaxID=2856853 RepID=UPI001C85DF24|nr:LysR substrate-binding domain-containing protein [Actinoplanes polyasparticus]
MELRYLVAFVAVAEELHFGRAARRLRMAQPPLSQTIRKLGRELGVRLFERSTRWVRLTSVDDTFLEPARRVLEDVDVATRAARSAGASEYGQVVIGLAGCRVMRCCPSWPGRSRSPIRGLDLVMREHKHANRALERVANGTLELGFVRMPVSRPGLRTRVVGNDHLVCALPKHHRLAGKEEIDLQDLTHESFVSLPANVGSTLRDVMIRTCDQVGFTPRVVPEAPDSNTVLALVSAGTGVTLTSKSVERALPGVLPVSYPGSHSLPMGNGGLVDMRVGSAHSGSRYGS